MYIADAEYAVGCARFRGSLGAADLVETACGTGADGEVVTGIGLQAGECDNVYEAFAGYVPAAVGSNLFVQVVRVCAVIHECIGRFGLFVHLPEHLYGVRGRCHRVGLFVWDIRIIAVVIRLFGYAPARITDVAAVSADTDGGTVLVELEVTCIGIYEVRVAVDAVNRFGAGTGFDRSVAGEAVLSIRVRAIYGVTNCAIALRGVHEDAVGDMSAIDVCQIDASRVGAVVERAMVNIATTFQRNNIIFIAGMHVYDTPGAILAAVERAVLYQQTP